MIVGARAILCVLLHLVRADDQPSSP